MTDCIRRATGADLPAIIALLADDALGSTREDVSQPPSAAYQAAFAAIDADANQFFAVLDRQGGIIGGGIIGCLHLTFIPGLSRRGVWRGQIESVRISSRCRGEGLGHRLLVWAIDRCRAHGCGLVQLTTDKARPDALRFYEDLGFVASHEGLKLTL